MQHLDEGMIHTWLDGELPPSEREAAEAHVATCDECRAAVAEARGFVAASSRILTALDAVPGGVLPASSTSSVGGGARTPARFRLSRAWMAAAAVLVLSTATIIVIRPRGESPAMRVADGSTEAKATEMTPTAAPPMRPPAAPAEDRPALAGKITDKTSSREFAERKDERRKIADSGTFTVATSEPEARARDESASVTNLAAGAGATSNDAMAKAAAPSQSALDSRSVRVESRRTSVARGDTVITTVYNVRGAQITLIDRSAPQTDMQRATNATAQSPSKPGNVAAPMNSITWSDSTGRTRTLRGPVSQAELERIKTELFGATP